MMLPPVGIWLLQYHRAQAYLRRRAVRHLVIGAWTGSKWS